MSKNVCVVDNCGASINSGFLMCRRHWSRVSVALKAEINATWKVVSARMGNSESLMDALMRYRVARTEAIRVVNEKVSAA